MQIIKYSEVNTADIVSQLKQGKTIVYPTETCYGLGCDATNESAVRRLFAIKQRQEDKPMLVLAPALSMIRKYIVWSPRLEELARRYWPGPLTVVADVLGGVTLPAGVVGPEGTLAFRVTSHPLAAALGAGLGLPLVSTSANLSATVSPYDSESVRAMFAGALVQPDIVIDAGPLPHHSPSTVVRVAGNRTRILRQGEIVIRQV